MFINWLIGIIGKDKPIESSKVYPMVFSIHEGEIEEFLNWMRVHNCHYVKNCKTKDLLNQYSNEEIIKNGFVSMAFEQYGNDGTKSEGDISIILSPSVLGTNYKLRCRCGEEFEPTNGKQAKKKSA